MQQQNRQHDRTRLEPRQHRDEIKLGRDRKDDRAEHEIDGEDVHLRLPPRIDAKDPAPEGSWAAARRDQIDSTGVDSIGDGGPGERDGPSRDRVAEGNGAVRENDDAGEENNREGPKGKAGGEGAKHKGWRVRARGDPQDPTRGTWGAVAA